MDALGNAGEGSLVKRQAAIVRYDAHRDAFFILRNGRYYLTPLRDHVFTDGERVYRECKDRQWIFPQMYMVFATTKTSFMEPIGRAMRWEYRDWGKEEDAQNG